MIFSYRSANRWLLLTLLVWWRTVKVAWALKANVTLLDGDAAIVLEPVDAWTRLDWRSSTSQTGESRSARMGYAGSDPSWDGSWLRSRLDGIGKGLGLVLEERMPSSRKLRESSQTRSRPSSPSGDDDRPPTTLRVEFTGSAIYIYGFTPIPSSATIFLDGRTQLHPPSDETTQRSSSDHDIAPVFHLDSLEEGRHTLELNLGEGGTIFLLDRVVYTKEMGVWRYQQPRAPQDPSPTTTAQQVTASGESPIPGSSSSSDTTEPTPSASETPTKKRNVATFGAAVGGSVGVLALFSAGLALSIIRRRYKAKKRERLDRENNTHPVLPHGTRIAREMSENSGSGSDVSFVPRYFPGTEVPPPAGHGRSGTVGASGLLSLPLGVPPRDPPGYNDVVRANRVGVPGERQHPYIHREPPRAPSPDMDGDLSYADIPPSESPPPGVEVALLPDGLVPPPPALGGGSSRRRSRASADEEVEDEVVMGLGLIGVGGERGVGGEAVASRPPPPSFPEAIRDGSNSTFSLGRPPLGVVGPGSHPGVSPEPSPHSMPSPERS